MDPKQKPTLLSWEECKWSLGKLWLAGAVVFAVVILATAKEGRFEIPSDNSDPHLQKLAQAYPNQTTTVLKWAMHAIVPSISLIIGALLSNIGSPPSRKSKTVDARHFHLIYGLSALYLLALVFIVWDAYTARWRGVAIFDSSSIWQVPFQVACDGFLTAFYVRTALAEPAPQKPASE